MCCGVPDGSGLGLTSLWHSGISTLTWNVGLQFSGITCSKEFEDMS